MIMFVMYIMYICGGLPTGKRLMVPAVVNCGTGNPPIPSLYCLPYANKSGMGAMRPHALISMPIKNGDDPFREILKTNPELSESIKKILEYSGIMTPWNQVMDFFDVNQRPMPDPYMLYRKVRDILKLLESIKEKISEELMKVEIYINRAETYAEENHKRLKRNLDKMTEYYRKIKKTKDQGIRNEYIKKFEDIKRETQTIINSYMGLKNWLFKIMAYFKQLFN